MIELTCDQKKMLDKYQVNYDYEDIDDFLKDFAEVIRVKEDNNDTLTEYGDLKFTFNEIYDDYYPVYPLVLADEDIQMLEEYGVDAKNIDIDELKSKLADLIAGYETEDDRDYEYQRIQALMERIESANEN